MNNNPKPIIDFEWLDGTGVPVESHARTWSTLTIQAGDRIATRVQDLRAKAMRNRLFAPLMPLAEWIAQNWWFLLDECVPPSIATPRYSYRTSRPEDRGWYQRHNMLAAREGFPLPDLTIAREDDDALTVACEPDPEMDSPSPVRFTELFRVSVAREATREQFAVFLRAVLVRLDGVNTMDAVALRARCNVIFTADSEGQVLMQRAAALGLAGDDPDEVDEALADQLIHGFDHLPNDIAREIVEAPGPPSKLKDRVEFVEQARQHGQFAGGNGTGLAKARDQVCAAITSSQRGYECGWAMARRFRESVIHAGLGTYGDTLDGKLAEAALLNVSWAEARQDALVGWLRADVPGKAACVLAKRPRSTADRFLEARALALALLGGRERLVTDASSRPQQVARSFAAELLAPAEALKNNLSGAVIEEDEVFALAKQFGVGPAVVRHQIENHDLAAIVEE